MPQGLEKQDLKRGNASTPSNRRRDVKEIRISLPPGKGRSKHGEEKGTTKDPGQGGSPQAQDRVPQAGTAGGPRPGLGPLRAKEPAANNAEARRRQSQDQDQDQDQGKGQGHKAPAPRHQETQGRPPTGVATDAGQPDAAADHPGPASRGADAPEPLGNPVNRA